ncbi:hypothetical protein K504DRAFT_535825 [Pleomassaria siparia CBS 279.74]|uniref:Zn(2)-C6 fungal-type domain-containing protein n=1 Tax=Pleomassaria siparia CBS 279.74 TaxID=1314801 RepID=A0A6G1K4D9_9PLEO|nr:hypothetical protein K504DRAFT_535825 [Pleomassaria siparia CBS 279.74]
MPMEESKLLHKRASMSRSRTGCATCRRRRIKCDEGYPHCLRCLKAKLTCEGYFHAQPSTQTSSCKPILLPKPGGVCHMTSLAWQARPCPRYKVARLSTPRPTAILLGETEVENRYLKYFHHETTSGFQSAYDWTLWNRLVLQGCHHEPFIRYAVVAIGALHKSMPISSPSGEESLTKNSQPMAKLHREFAYLTYGKALKYMQQAIDSGTGLRHALIACLLVVCFETHTGNRYKASTHAKYGLQILQQWRKSTPPQIATSALAPPDVEEDIVEAFRNLDIQITTVSDSRTFEEHERSMEEDLPIVMSMPTYFDGLETAKMYCTIIMRRSNHFMGTTWTRTRPDLLTRAFKTQEGSTLVSLGDQIHTTAFTVDDTVREEQKPFFAEVVRWLEAFEPVFSRIRQAGHVSPRKYVIATILQIQALCLKITLAGVLFTQEILYDEYLPEFKEIVRLSADVAKICHSNSSADFWAGSFLLDLGLVMPLFSLILRCRAPVLRRHAIDILMHWHVECWWDPLLIVALGRFVMEVEEVGMKDEFIPEESRAILTAKSHRPPDRVLLVQCVQRTGGPGRGLTWTERYIKW